MRRVFSLFIFAVLVVVPSAIFAGEGNEGAGWAVDAKVGTMGIGADLSRSIVPRVMNFRVGASFFSYSTDFDENGINYDAELKLGAIPIAIDVFPFKNWFRIGGGVVINLNEVKGTGQSNSGTIDIGNSTYPLQDIGVLTAKTKFNRAAPYVGIGFNNPIKRSGHFGFFADLGVLYHGTPTITMNATRSFPQLQEDIDREIREFNDEIKDYKLYPVIQVGISYKF